MQYTDYREYLKDVLAARARQNPRYSMRALARDLGVSAQRLSLVLNGKRGLSRDAAAAISTKLEMMDHEVRFFCDLVEYSQARGEAAKKVSSAKLWHVARQSKFKQVSEDVFKTMSEWYYFALLELTTLRGFNSDINWIAKRLGLEVSVVEEAIERLKRIGMLEETESGFRQTQNDIMTTHDVPSEALRNYHKQILGKAFQAIDNQTVEERDITNVIVPTTPEKIKKAKELIREFRRNLGMFLEEGNGTEIYNLSIQLFRLTETEEN